MHEEMKKASYNYILPSLFVLSLESIIFNKVYLNKYTNLLYCKKETKSFIN